MLVSDKHKILFVHIPKTAGSCVRMMMRQIDSECYEYKEHHSILQEPDADIFKDYFKFTVVRNSYKLCASFYRFMTEKIEALDERQESVGIIDLIQGQITTTKNSTDWQRGQAKNPFPVQLDYFSKKEKVFVDKVYIYDKGLDVQMEDLKKKINFKGLLDKKTHTNYFGDYDWKSYYDEKTIEYITRVCQKDIKHFDFKF